MGAQKGRKEGRKEGREVRWGANRTPPRACAPGDVSDIVTG